MAIGDRHREQFHCFADPFTRRPVTRLTSLTEHCYHPYFYCRQFTPDGRRLLYLSSRTGRPQAYLLDLETGEAEQVTAATELHPFLPQLDAEGRQLFYVDGQELHRRELATGDDTALYRQPEPWTAGPVYPGFSDDCRLALLCQMHRNDRVPHGEGWSFFQPQWDARPRCRLVLLDMETGAETVIREEPCWLGHPQIRPGDPTTLMYCHEGPSHLVDARIWLIDSKGDNARPLGYVEPEPGAGAGETVTHEYFTPDGRYIAYTHFPETYGHNGSIRLTEVATMAETNLGPVHNYSHFYHSPDCTRIVGDEADPDRRPECCVWVFDIARREERPLALHGSSFACRGTSTQDAHPHPAWAPHGRTVVFTSDRETGPDGNCAVYLTTADGLFD